MVHDFAEVQADSPTLHSCPALPTRHLPPDSPRRIPNARRSARSSAAAAIRVGDGRWSQSPPSGVASAVDAAIEGPSCVVYGRFPVCARWPGDGRRTVLGRRRVPGDGTELGRRNWQRPCGWC